MSQNKGTNMLEGIEETETQLTDVQQRVDRSPLIRPQLQQGINVDPQAAQSRLNSVQVYNPNLVPGNPPATASPVPIIAAPINANHPQDIPTSSEFTFFPLLPSKLRQRIFALAIKDPAVIDLHYRPNPTDPLALGKIIDNSLFTSLFNTNHEARTVVMTRCPIAINPATDQATTTTIPSSPRFHPEKDTLLLAWDGISKVGDRRRMTNSTNSSYLCTAWSPRALSTLQHLAIDHRIWRRWMNFPEFVDITGFTALQTFTVVIHVADLGSGCTWLGRQCQETWGKNENEKGVIGLVECTDGLDLRMLEKGLKWFLKMQVQLPHAVAAGWVVPRWEMRYLTRDGTRCCGRGGWSDVTANLVLS